jgi:DNA-binding SARP family transcriptional activator/thioredoxin-like negative regulator of GroEL
LQIAGQRPDIVSGALSIQKPFELRLLGPFELVHCSSGEVIAISSSRLKALIAFLATAPRGSETRRKLAGHLWASKEDDLARQSLRALLSQFKRGADPRIANLIQGDDSTISLDCSLVDIDRTSLIEAPADADISALKRASDSYRSEFAAGLEIGEAEFDNWLEAERFRCREMAIRVLDRLVRALAVADRHEEALNYANRLVQIDPLREETHRLVIAEEAIVSGRASAMARFEQFRLILKEQLAVRPEAATQHLLESLRQTRIVTAAPNEIEIPLPPPPTVASPPIRRGFWGVGSALPLLALVLGCGLVLLVAFTVLQGSRTPNLADASVAPNGGAGEHVIVAFAPFDLSEGLDRLPDRTSIYENEVRRVFAQSQRLTVSPLLTGSPVLSARRRNATYLLQTELSQSNEGPKATAFLYDVKTGTRIYAGVLLMPDDAEAFARHYFDLMYPAILLDHARALAAENPNSVATLVWEAAVEEVWDGDRAADPPELIKLEAAIAKDPQNLDALVGLAWSLIERAARDQSTGLNRIYDIYRGERRLQQARQLETVKSQPATLSRVAYLEGLLDKVQSRYADARSHFVEALRYTPDNTQAAAQVAHIDLFLGDLEQAYAEIEAIPHIDYTESSFVAAESALMAGHPDRALFYYDRAVSTTPDIPRNYAWRAIALWRLHRKDESHQNAMKSQDMKPAYRSYWITNRSPLADKRYRDARDLCATDFEAALKYKPPTGIN